MRTPAHEEISAIFCVSWMLMVRVVSELACSAFAFGF
jgi:hypothetical protein